MQSRLRALKTLEGRGICRSKDFLPSVAVEIINRCFELHGFDYFPCSQRMEIHAAVRRAGPRRSDAFAHSKERSLLSKVITLLAIDVWGWQNTSCSDRTMSDRVKFLSFTTNRYAPYLYPITVANHEQKRRLIPSAVHLMQLHIP
uniref:Uncharacterized protein n=1 Tax=Micrurus spixii TaxID=129469 RepID=A0A2D4MY92_9SAUR